MTFATLLALLAVHCPLLPAKDRTSVAHLVATASDPVLVVAVMHVESRGLPTACGNDPHGTGSSRGTMQVHISSSRCGDRQRPELYRASVSTREGIAILEHLLHQESVRQALRRYSGGSDAYARRVLQVYEQVRRSVP